MSGHSSALTAFSRYFRDNQSCNWYTVLQKQQVEKTHKAKQRENLNICFHTDLSLHEEKIIHKPYFEKAVLCSTLSVVLKCSILVVPHLRA